MVDFSTISFRDLVDCLGDYIGDAPIHFTPKAELNPENYVLCVFIGEEETDAIRRGVHNKEFQYDNSDVGLHFPEITIDCYYHLEEARNPIAQEINMGYLQKNRKTYHEEKNLWFALFCVLHEIGHWKHFKQSGLSAIDYEKSIHDISKKYKEIGDIIFSMPNFHPLKMVYAEKYHKESHEQIPSEKAADEYALDHFDEALSMVRKALGYDEEWLSFHSY